MPQFGNYVVDQLIVPSVVWFFFIGGVAAALVGAGLILRHDAILRLFRVMNREVSTRLLSKPLAIPRDSDGLAWKYRRPLAAFFAIGAAYSLYGLIAHADDAALAALLKLDYPPLAIQWMVESARLFLIAGCVLSLAIGILIGFFPDTMRTLERQASRWVSTRRLVPDADKMVLTLDDWVAVHPRMAGWMVLLPALGMVFYFGALLRG